VATTTTLARGRRAASPRELLARHAAGAAASDATRTTASGDARLNRAAASCHGDAQLRRALGRLGCSQLPGYKASAAADHPRVDGRRQRVDGCSRCRASAAQQHPILRRFTIRRAHRLASARVRLQECCIAASRGDDVAKAVHRAGWAERVSASERVRCTQP
jgi:hypothetical protein